MKEPDGCVSVRNRSEGDPCRNGTSRSFFIDTDIFVRFKGLLCEAENAENIDIDSYIATCSPLHSDAEHPYHTLHQSGEREKIMKTRSIWMCWRSGPNVSCGIRRASERPCFTIRERIMTPVF